MIFVVSMEQLFLSEAKHPWRGSSVFHCEGRVHSQESHVRFVGQSSSETGFSSRASVCPSQFIIPPIRYIHSSIIRCEDSGPITGHISTETNSCKTPAHRRQIYYNLSRQGGQTISDCPIWTLEHMIFVREIRIDSEFSTIFSSYRKGQSLAALEADQ